jgi:PAS domain S-box-containing protein
MTHAIQEEILLSLVRNSMDAIETADGVIDYWNPAAEQLYGYTAAEAIGQPSTLLVPPEKLAEYASMREQLARGERIDHFDTQRVRKDGTMIDVEISAFPVMDQTGKLAATSTITHDLTERRKLQQSMGQTAQLKADFLAKMLHEIRTPLNAIIGTAELQMLSDMPPEQKRRMGIIQSSGELLMTIVDDILDYSKLSAGKMVIESEDFNLATLAEGLIEAFAQSAHAKSLELAFYMEAGIPPGLRGSPNRIRQVLNNLLSNAIKFTPAGEVLLRITIVESNPTDMLISFEVSDTGIGIPLAVQSQLFKPFVQAEQSANRRFGGTGLGLVISAELVANMGGTIELKSEDNKGSSFSFALRLSRSQLSTPDAMRHLAAKFTGIKALIVGNRAISRGVIAEYLSACGIENHSLADESAVINELRSASSNNQSYSVVLLDNGPTNLALQLAQLVKRDPILNTTKTIIMSSSIPSDLNGAVDYWLGKPAYPPRLFDALDCLFLLQSDGRYDSPAVIPEQYVERTPLCVLVVEDNLTNQTLIAAQLSALGCEVKIVGNAVYALRRLGEQDFDIVLMDCELPGMDGYEATAEIRRREGNLAHTHIIAFTAHVSEDQASRCLEAGMDEYLGKPLKLKTLTATLDAYRRKHEKLVHNMRAEKIEDTGDALEPAAVAEIAELSKVSGRNLFRKLADDLISDLSRQGELITAAISAGDMSALAREIHPLSSAAAIVGAVQFSIVCAKVEQQARANNVDEAGKLVKEVLRAATLLPDVLRSADSYR